MPLGFAVEPDEYRMNSGCSADKGHRRADRVDALAELVVPDVAALLHLALGARGAHDDDVLERADAGDLGVDRGLDRRGLALAPGAVDGDQHLGLADLHPLGHRGDREAAEDDVVHGADTRAGQHRDDDLGDHRQVDPDDVLGFDPERLQPVGQLLDVAQQIGVGDGPLLALFAMPVVGDPIAPPCLDVTVQAVVRDVELAVGEPPVERRAAVVQHLGEGGRPVDEQPGLLRPEGGDRGAVGGRPHGGLLVRDESRRRREALDLEQLLQLVLQAC